MDLTNIDPTVTTSLVNLGASLSTLALKETVAVVHSKVEALKTSKDVNNVRNAYNEIISELLEERNDAVLIAQTYKQELERVSISDEDIEYLQDTVAKVIDIISVFQAGGSAFSDGQKAAIKAADNLKTLISKDVLKTMQLLGFNYKAAIGEPLTQLCANAVLSLGNRFNKAQPTKGGNNRR